MQAAKSHDLEVLRHLDVLGTRVEVATAADQQLGPKLWVGTALSMRNEHGARPLAIRQAWCRRLVRGWGAGAVGQVITYRIAGECAHYQSVPRARMEP